MKKWDRFGQERSRDAKVLWKSWSGAYQRFSYHCIPSVYILGGDEGLWSYFPSSLLFFVMKDFDATKMFRLQHLYETLVFSRRETLLW